jgi:hypothetical protein
MGMRASLQSWESHVLVQASSAHYRRSSALVASGAVKEGMRNLDEVNAAVIAGELTDRVAIGLAGCYLIAACERVHDLECGLMMKRMCSTHFLGTIQAPESALP